MIADLPPAALLLLGAWLVPLLRGRVLKTYLVALPVASLVHMIALPEGAHRTIEFLGHTLVLARIDRLSLVFGLVFHIVAILSVIYALHVRDRVQHVAGLVYAGSATAALFAGDLITLFVFWELTALSSVFLIWARRSERSLGAGMRYLVVQVLSGVLLLAGTVFHLADTGSIAFDHLGTGSLGTNLIFLAFGIKCAFPFLHNWLQDAYPEATVTGTVFLSAFTTKLAVYALARGFAGTEILIGIGVAMTIFPIFYAVIENDLRRVLAYSLNNQVGFMVVGIGVGTEMALNGTAAHAFAHVIYKALLFMSMGAVLHRTGTIKASELGGLYKSMPFTAVCCVIGAASIAGLPPFSGFVSKSMTMTGLAGAGYALAYLGLLFASAGVMEHSGIKIPYFAFFGHDSGIRCKEAPANMIVAMGAAALLCVAIGVRPQLLYGLLPYPVDFVPYTASHVVTQLQLLLWAALAFCVLIRTGIYPAETPSVNLDSDWVYRRLVPNGLAALGRTAAPVRAGIDRATRALLGRAAGGLVEYFGPQGFFARTWTTNGTVLWVAVILVMILLLYYI